MGLMVRMRPHSRLKLQGVVRFHTIHRVTAPREDPGGIAKSEGDAMGHWAFSCLLHRLQVLSPGSGRVVVVLGRRCGVISWACCCCLVTSSHVIVNPSSCSVAPMMTNSQSVIIRRLVATSLLATWHLGLCVTMDMGGEVVSAHLKMMNVKNRDNAPSGGSTPKTPSIQSRTAAKVDFDSCIGSQVGPDSKNPSKFASGDGRSSPVVVRVVGHERRLERSVSMSARDMDSPVRYNRVLL